ncbi:dephospho-CoA kinase [Paenibacillus sp. FSL M7-1455]|jgi:dephospho-CoA kinase|uniref:dephospho-CoA kinase n=1 Tax=Paenibacillus sp. FSL M7-1455 TaxID=2975316 RepID=UPI0005442624|nr:Dephospho-CoA kinase [Paenibacillus sp. P1XP2]HWO55724.1 dephospho-CoA kinase [Paenibacillus cookii]
MNIGLTGGIATGKSTVSALLVNKGALLVDADAIAREVMLPGHPVLAAVAEHFGQAVILEDGTLDRKKLGDIVFRDPTQRKALNDITHPAIRKEIRGRMDDLQREHPDKLVVVDIPLLYESGLEHMFERVMVVYAPEHVQLERLMRRNQLTAEEAAARIRSQMDIEEKKRKADIVIDNSGDAEETERQVDRFWLQAGYV